MNEIRTLESMKHQNILTCFEFLHSTDYYFIVTELVHHGDIFQYYCDRQEADEALFDEKQIQAVAKQLFSALNHLHQNNIFHRDVKLDNLLLDGFGKNNEPLVKLSDFGFAVKLGDNEYPKDRVGTYYYMSPELILKKGYDYKSDVWGAMVTIYALIYGNLPFYGESFKEVSSEILNYDMQKEIKTDPQWQNASYWIKDFFSKGFQKDPKNRPTAQQMLNHPWLRSINLPEPMPVIAETFA